MVSYQHESALAPTLENLRGFCDRAGLKPARIFGRFLPRQNDDRDAPVLVEGDSELSLTTTVHEAGLRYGVDFGAGYSAGLFLDQRANRAFVRSLGPQRLLNTFAYTCSFSVVAAAAGGTTVSVDLSKKSVERGRENFTLNGLSDEGHRFIADDVLDVLPRLAKRGEQFDTIILDPPTFSRGNRGRKFQVERDLESLLASALEIAAPKARILLSTNCTRLTQRDVEQIARFALKLNRLNGELHREPSLPDIPPDLAAHTVWLTVRN